VIILWLPFPPSLNSLYPGKVRRHKSEKYEVWIKEAGQALMQQDCSMRFDKPVCVAYKFGQPNKKKRDLDNLLKAPNDLLVAHGIIADDSLIHRISAEWADGFIGIEVEISSF